MGFTGSEDGKDDGGVAIDEVEHKISKAEHKQDGQDAQRADDELHGGGSS